MSLFKIKKMVEDGFSIKRISVNLNLDEKYIKNLLKSNNWTIVKECFELEKIDRICSLYESGVSAKQLGLKFSIDKRRIQKWVKERGILRDKNSSHRFTNFNQNIFDSIDCEEKAYWLGFFYADAYNCDITNTFSLSIKDDDYDHLVKLCKFIGLSSSKIKRYIAKINDKEYAACTLRIYSKHICNKMIELGCPRAKSFVITFPGWLDKTLYSHFIRGLFDGDGCITYNANNDSWKWSLVSTKECCESIQNIINNELGFKLKYTCISNTNNNTYEFQQLGNKKVLQLMQWIYNDASIYLDRKYLRFKQLEMQQNNRQFSKDNYKVSDIVKLQIQKELKVQTVSEISKMHNLHARTVRKIKSNPIKAASLYDQIVEINGQLITAPYVKTLDYNEREALVEPLFEHFRKQGWLYPDNDSELKKSYKKLCDWEPDLTSNELFNNSSLATDICKYFCHKFYDATERKASTMKEVFYDDDKLRRLIRNRLGFDWWENENNDETFNISFRMLIQGMRSSRLVPSISMFKPNIAKYMYMKYSNENDIIYDYSVGWGGRMLGAASCNRKYIGIDPWTIDEVTIMKDYFNLQNITLIKDGSENVKLQENSIDFSFSSPPYFDQEYYCDDLSQSYNNGEDYFYNVYWKNTLENIKYMLKPDKWFGLNVTHKYPKMIDMAKEVFGDVIEEVQLRTIKSHLNKVTKKSDIKKYEPIFMFKNRK